jgi:SAM-dependent methyltransferase
MAQTLHSSEDLQQLYKARFAGKSEYRRRVWKVLCSYFSRWIDSSQAVLDLGCGYCEFINMISCRSKFAMDLNPDARKLAADGVTLLEQDCSDPWKIEPQTLDAVFTSNFFEHLPTKASLEATLIEAHRALKPAGCLIAMGPNIKAVPGKYWDFFDHYLPLTELSLAEVLKKCGFSIEVCEERFLPYTMSDGREYPIWVLRTYLSLPIAWKIFGEQFLVIARKRTA